ALDIVALERAAVAPDVDVIAFHREDEHRAGDRAPERRRVEVGDASGGDVEGPTLERGDALLDELRAAVDQPRLLGAILQRLPRDLVVVLLVRLTEVRRVGVGDRAFRAHPVKGSTRIEAARKRDADFLACWYLLKDRCHAISNRRSQCCRVQKQDPAYICASRTRPTVVESSYGQTWGGSCCLDPPSINLLDS